jgi:hypothetical protein
MAERHRFYRELYRLMHLSADTENQMTVTVDGQYFRRGEGCGKNPQMSADHIALPRLLCSVHFWLTR